MSLKEDLIKTLQHALEIIDMMSDDNAPEYDTNAEDAIINYLKKLQQ